MIFRLFGRKLGGQPLAIEQQENVVIVTEEEKVKNYDDELLDSINGFRLRMDNAKFLMIEEQENSLKDAEARIKKAEKFVLNSGLHVSLLSVQKEFWHWPSSSKNEHFSAHLKYGISNVKGTELSDEYRDRKSISFEYESEQYRYEFDVGKKTYEGTSFGEIRFFHEEKLVVAINISHDLNKDSYYDQWDYMSVKALQTGPWVGHIVEIEKKIELEHQKTMLETRSKRVKEQSQNLPN